VRGSDTSGRNREALTGLLTAGLALAVGEFGAGVSRSLVSPVAAVGDLIVDRAPGSVVRTSIRLLGTAQKPLLLAGIVLCALGLGALLARRSPADLRMGLFGFGLFGGWAMARAPLASETGSWLLATGMVVVGLIGLGLRPGFPVSDPADGSPGGPSHEDPRIKYADRRGFLAYAGGMGGTAVGLLAAGRLVEDRSARELRARVQIPSTTVPDTTVPDTTAADTTAADTTVPDTTAPTTVPELPDVPGLDPWITPNHDFYRIDTALTVPVIDPATWSLGISGLVRREVSIGFDDLLDMEVHDATVTLACVSNEVGGPLVGNAVWTGVLLADVLALADPQPAAEQVMAWSVDGFSAGFPLDAALDGRTALVAFGMNGEPLPLEHGFPVRLVVPGLYGYVSAVKWLFRLELTDWSDKGYWIPRGWAQEAPVKISSRIDVPFPRRVPAGIVPLAGVAWYPDVGVAAVEVSIDDGRWRECELLDAKQGGEQGRPAPGRRGESWVQWLRLWEATPGNYKVRVRAIGTDGTVQSGARLRPAPDGAEGYHEVGVIVEEAGS
tara:strand:+ start:3800 stop:5461 length:1662 start_codon:yes stop_codon:yes gene_type:complete